jgi:hypothetical protein
VRAGLIERKGKLAQREMKKEGWYIVRRLVCSAFGLGCEQPIYFWERALVVWTCLFDV